LASGFAAAGGGASAPEHPVIPRASAVASMAPRLRRTLFRNMVTDNRDDTEEYSC
jgi:hypothetical protein